MCHYIVSALYGSLKKWAWIKILNGGKDQDHTTREQSTQGGEIKRSESK